MHGSAIMYGMVWAPVSIDGCLFGTIAPRSASVCDKSTASHVGHTNIGSGRLRYFDSRFTIVPKRKSQMGLLLHHAGEPLAVEHDHAAAFQPHQPFLGQPAQGAPGDLAHGAGALGQLLVGEVG